MKPAVALCLLAILAIGARLPGEAYQAALRSLVETERAFSARSVKDGMRDAFLSYLADDGVLFRPFPVNGKQLWAARGQSKATLIWEPSYAVVSAAGDLGYTTGPWEFRPEVGGADSASHGHFISVWKKQADSTWRLIVDIGINHEKPPTGLGKVTLIEGPAPARVRAARGANALAADDPRLLDEALARDAKAGLGASFLRMAARDVRLNLEGAAPRLGVAAAGAALDTVKGTPRFVPQGWGIATSRDLAYTYGVLELKQGPTPDTTVYVHVWRRAPRKWELALAVLNPVRR